MSIAASVDAVMAEGGAGAWRLTTTFSPSKAKGEQCLLIRPVEEGDVAKLTQFGRYGLGDVSRAKFAPFDWDGEGLSAQLAESIANHTSKRDLHYVCVGRSTPATPATPAAEAAEAAEDTVEGKGGDAIVAQCFLWSACDPIPELGVAVADAWQGQGVGKAMLKMMELLARGLKKEALELTTMQTNEPAFAAYKKAGYEHLGLIRNPIGVDVTAAFAGEVKATRFCDERHMVLVLDESKREGILNAMSQKRDKALAIFGAPNVEAP